VIGSPEPAGEVPLRAAATVMLVRDGDDPTASLEVLMVRRNPQSAFVGGAYVFPGGAVDPADGGTDAQAFCQGRDDAEASEILGLVSGGLAYWVAALRECFEEAGVLLAYSGAEVGSRRLLSLADQGDAARFARHRLDVNAGRRRFLDACSEEGLSLAVDRVHYFAHWITPYGAPRRYDTRFFVAAAPSEQTPAHDAGETIAAMWMRPADALARHRAGEIELIFPTIRNLQAIGRFSHSEALLASAAAAVGVPAILPRVVADGRGVRILVPGDPGYEAATPGPPERGAGALSMDIVESSGGQGSPIDFTEAVRSVSLEANRTPPEPGSSVLPPA